MTEYTINLGSGRAAATAIRNLAELESDEGTKAAVLSIASQLEEQVKPAIEEPLAFGSVVKVRYGTLYVRLGAALALPWGSGEQLRSWDQLDVVEVLRIGIGEAIRPAVGDVEPEYTEDYEAGFSAAVYKVRGCLQLLMVEAITSERKSALDKAYAAVGDLTP